MGGRWGAQGVPGPEYKPPTVRSARQHLSVPEPPEPGRLPHRPSPRPSNFAGGCGWAPSEPAPLRPNCPGDPPPPPRRRHRAACLLESTGTGFWEPRARPGGECGPPRGGRGGVSRRQGCLGRRQGPGDLASPPILAPARPRHRDGRATATDGFCRWVGGRQSGGGRRGGRGGKIGRRLVPGDLGEGRTRERRPSSFLPPPQGTRQAAASRPLLLGFPRTVFGSGQTRQTGWTTWRSAGGRSAA